MKFNFLFIIIPFILFFSCRNAVNTEKGEDSNDKEQTAQEKILHESEIEETAENEVEDNKSPQKKMLALKLIYNCDMNKKYPSEELLSKYAKRQPYNVVQRKDGSRIYIEFSFLDDCCTRHQAYAEIRDTIKISTTQITKEVCECWCNYRYSVSIPVKKLKKMPISINAFLLEEYN